MQHHSTFCRICESLCGLQVSTQNNQVIDIKPDENHLATDGFSCVKGLKQHDMYQSPDRLKHPLKRMDDGSYEKVSWEIALKEIGEKVKKIRKEDSPDSIGMYVGTAAGFSVLHPVFAQGFMTGIGSKSMYATATQDCSNKFAVSRFMYGFPFTLTFPDLLNSECLIIVGANPVISKWSFLQVPNPAKKLKEMERRGARIYVVDPRETETAQTAGEHVFIEPGTDIFFYLSFLNELNSQGGVDHDYVSKHMEGLEEVLQVAGHWPADKTAPVTGISSGKLKEIVSIYKNSKGAALYCSTGVNMGENGTLAFWIQEVINAVSGNLDRTGGTLVSKGIIDFVKFGVKNGVLMRDDKSRIGNFGAVNDAYPGGIMADEILTPGDRQLKALFVTGGNPLITMPNAEKLKEAFQKLELLVTVDIYHNETGSVADYVLPATDPLQRPDLPFIFPLMLGLQLKPYIQATDAIRDPEGDQWDESTIYYHLCKASGIPIFGSRIAQLFMDFLVKTSRKGTKSYQGIPQRLLLSLILKICGQPGFKKLLKYPNGKKLPDHMPGSFLGKRVHTQSGKVDLAPEALTLHASKLAGDFKSHQKPNGYKLITRRQVTTHNSWTHNIERMVPNGRHTNYVYMNGSDMAREGLNENDLVEVSTEVNRIKIRVKNLDTLNRGTVAVPHGWGHQHSQGLSIASKTEGVNVNLLAADGPERIDKVSGMANLTGFPVKIRKSSEDLKKTWSGFNL